VYFLDLVGKITKLLAFFPWIGLGFGNKGLEERRREERDCFGDFCSHDGYYRNNKVRNRAGVSVSSCPVVSFSAEASNLKVWVTLMSVIRV